MPETGTAHGPGRVLIAVYAIFALAATARAGVQIATKFSDAPLAYLLSAFAAVVCCSIELIGVLAVGTFSLLVPDDFPDAAVWSDFGSGYGFVPLILPVLGLLWLRRTRP